MMNVLFLDTTVNADIGLFDGDKFIELDRGGEQKASHKFHYRIYDLLKKNSLKVEDVDVIFQLAGPGSYTGMRLSEGFSNLLTFNNIKVYSIYHYEVPKLCKINEYLFVSNAFKGEYFVYSYSCGEESIQLVRCDDFKQGELPIFSNEDLQKINVDNTLSLLEKYPHIISDCIASETKRDLYYYRPIEEEFKLKEKLR